MAQGELSPFAYVAHSRCGHVNFLAVEPHPSDVIERRSLWADLKYYIVSGGYVRRIHRDELTGITLDLCSCDAESKDPP